MRRIALVLAVVVLADVGLAGRRVEFVKGKDKVDVKIGGERFAG